VHDVYKLSYLFTRLTALLRSRSMALATVTEPTRRNNLGGVSFVFDSYKYYFSSCQIKYWCSRFYFVDER
jgi:hypothetical protein